MRGNICKVPTRLQMEASECGAASLGMILEYYGRYIPLEKLREQCCVSRDGSNAASIVKAAKNFHNMIAKGYLKKTNCLMNKKIMFPAIIFWKNQHFLVLEGYDKGYFYLNDPASGPRKISKDDFNKDYSGICITFTPSNSFQKIKNNNNIIEDLMSNLGSNKSTVLLMFSLSLLLIFPGLLIPIFSQIFIDKYLIQSESGNFIYQLLGIMFIVLLFQSIILLFQKTILVRLSTKLGLILSTDFLHYLLRLPVSFFSQRFSGDLIFRIESLTSISNFLSGQLASSLINIIQVFFYAIIMFLYSWELSLISIISISLSIIVLNLCKVSLKEKTLKIDESKGRVMSSIFNGFQMLDTLKSTASENEFFSQWSGYYAKLINSERELIKTSLWLNILPSFFQSIASALILGIGAWFIFKGTLSIGELIAFQALTFSFSGPLLQLINFSSQIQTIKSIFIRSKDIYQYPTEIDTLDVNADKTYKFTGKIKLNNLSFGYNKAQAPLVDNFSLSTNPGSKVALVGGSGSGKSTISKIILGINNPWLGDVLFDGISIKKHSRTSFRYSISFVDQNIMLFRGTLRENLTLWGQSSCDRNLIKALKDACIEDVVSQRSGYLDCFVDDFGSNFSGGQKQRIEIARALSTNPSILILDEATSALDPVTEKKIMDNITRRGITCIIVAHRLSSIRDSDEIIVLDKGKIIERGTHTELIKNNQIYNNLMKKEG